MKKNEVSRETREAIEHTVAVINECKIIPKKIRGVEGYIFNDKHSVIVEYDDSKGDFTAGTETSQLNASCLMIVLDTLMKASREEDAPSAFNRVFHADYEFVDMVLNQRAINYMCERLV